MTQRVTGVQRYAWNVVTALNQALADKGFTAPIVTPKGFADPCLSAMPVIGAGPGTGHLWEQVVLPAYWRGPLLNLCNTAPALRTEQVVCVHDANVHAAPESYGRAFRAVYGALQPLLARRAARLTSVSSYAAREVARYLPVRAADIVVCPNGHEHALAWDPSLAHVSLQQSPGLADGPGRGFVLAIGSRARHKNLRLLLDAAPGLAALGIDVLVAGGGSGIFADATLRSAPNVKLLGYVTDHDLAFLMRRALCLVFPSWTEGFGLPIVEAMARGCPVISSDRASMPEVCGDAALMASPDDPAAWVRQVRSLLESRALREDLSGRGRERARLFSWAKTAASYLDLMREPVGHPRKCPVEVRSLPSVAVAVATLGRPEVVTATLRHLLERQSLKPKYVLVSCVNRQDAGDIGEELGVTILTGRAGLTAQRNAALAALPSDVDIVAFFDDDFIADKGWLEIAAQTFRDRADVVGFTGHVLADGIKGPGLSFSEAVRLVEEADESCTAVDVEPYSPYGCNMAFRLSAVGRLRFDERLPLYGWLEDRDFGAALARDGGRLLKCAAARGVHMGVKSGRVSGDRLGYSQVVNPLYMLRKGTMTVGEVGGQLFRNVSSNVAGAAKPEPFIDRRGRLRGNLLGLADVLRGRLDPERATTIRPATER